ncbi:MAG: hypothetical protein F6K28_07750 [Microcoleus sp. SIO2G3]|nr:hypothetical protein [Microcoleus sp. SIO2G3]
MLQSVEPFYMPEIGLGIGRGMGTYSGWTREWLYWYDAAGNRYPSPDEAVEQERSRAERLAERLRTMGIDPSDL